MPVDSNKVAKIVIKNNQEQILVLKRSDNGKMDLPGGHLHIGEDPIMGIIREVFEETKLVILNIEEIIKYKRKTLFESNSYSSLSNEEQIELDKNENSDFYWMSIKEFLDIEDDNATDVITAYKAYIKDDKKFWNKLR